MQTVVNGAKIMIKRHRLYIS